MTRARVVTATAAAVGLVGSVVLANWLTERYGFVHIGFGLSTTAGTLAAGAALALRDALQDTAGKWAVFAAVAVGAVMSLVIASPQLAVASAVAFAVSELADMRVYTPLRSRAGFGSKRWSAAVLLSGAVGAVVDTALFLWIACGWAAVMPAMAGQLAGKTGASLLFVVATLLVLVARKGVIRVVSDSSDRQPSRA